VGESAYDSLLPKSVAYRPVPVEEEESKVSVMPLVTLLKEGSERHEPGWHRNAERLARGLPPVSNASVQLEAWEKQLVRTKRSMEFFIDFNPSRPFPKSHA
jgi:hypothetical protein